MRFKVLLRATADRYVSKFEMCKISINQQKSELGVTVDTIARLSTDLRGKNYKIPLNNKFSSLPVIIFLKANNIYSTGTVRSNRINDENTLLKKKHPSK